MGATRADMSEINAALDQLDFLWVRYKAAERELLEHLDREPPEGPGRAARRERERWLAQAERKKAALEAAYERLQAEIDRAKGLIAAAKEASKHGHGSV